MSCVASADGVDCWSENTQLKFDSTTRKYSNFPGVRTWIPGWGNTDTIEYIDPSWTAWVLGNVGLYAKCLIDGPHCDWYSVLRGNGVA